MNNAEGFASENLSVNNEEDTLPVILPGSTNLTLLISLVNSTDIPMLEDYVYDVSESYDNYDWVKLKKKKKKKPKLRNSARPTQYID